MRLSILILLAVVITGCDASSQSSGPSTTADPALESSPPIIEVITVNKTLHQETISATGTVAAKQTSQIGPMVEGIIKAIYVRVGDRPRKGDPLFQVRTVEYQQAVDQARAAHSVATADLELKVKRLNRARQLVADNLLSDEDLDLTIAAMKIAQAQLQGARSALDAAQQRLKDTLVLAPFNGTITGRFVDEGVYMSNRFSMGDQSSVVELSEAEIVAGIMRAPEAVLHKLKLGQRALVYPGDRVEPIESEVLIINDRVDYQTRTAEFRLPIRNEDYAIKPGQFIRAEVMIEPAEVVKLPKTAILEINGTSQVALLGPSGFTPQAVSIRRLNDKEVEVTHGLTPNQQIAVNPKSALEAGSLTNLVVSHVDR
jgi:RND family efflux transporter MFP subunit